MKHQVDESISLNHSQSPFPYSSLRRRPSSLLLSRCESRMTSELLTRRDTAESIRDQFRLINAHLGNIVVTANAVRKRLVLIEGAWEALEKRQSAGEHEQPADSHQEPSYVAHKLPLSSLGLSQCQSDGTIVGRH